MPKGFIQTNHVPRKTYDYTLDGCNLNFSLRQDVKKELVAFKQLMIKAIKDIDEDLENVPSGKK